MIAALQRRLAPVLRPAAAAYGAAMRLRAERYADGRSPAYRATGPVVSIGNISWGGSGKTPVVDYLLDTTAAAGIRTVVLTRGYKAKPQSLPCPVGLMDDPALVGDEPLMLARRHPKALVVVDPKRGRAAAWAEANAGPGLFLLDDGMQHLAMRRDLDIVLLTPNDLLAGWNKVIPSGTWREDARALARAHAFCIKADEAALSAIAPVVEARLGHLDLPLFSFTLAPGRLIRLAPFGRGPEEIAPDIGGESYVLACGTGNPEQVAQTAAAFLGREPAHAMIVADHHRYTEADAKTMAAWRIPIVCTAKDAVKLAPLLPHFGDVPVWILDVRADFGPAFFSAQSFDQWWAERLDAILRRNGDPDAS